MGYTHYWRRTPTLDATTYAAWLRDARRVVAMSESMGIKLAGPMGDGPVEIDEDGGAFGLNGLTRCGHQRRQFGIAWPAAGATGIASESDPVEAGDWFAGAKLSARACGGDCSHETFRLDREHPLAQWEQAEGDVLSFSCCKTAYKPYDITVTALLLLARYHFKDAIVLSTDGTVEDWIDGDCLCAMAVPGYDPNLTHNVLAAAFRPEGVTR